MRQCPHWIAVNWLEHQEGSDLPSSCLQAVRLAFLSCLLLTLLSHVFSLLRKYDIDLITTSMSAEITDLDPGQVLVIGIMYTMNACMECMPTICSCIEHALF